MDKNHVNHAVFSLGEINLYIQLGIETDYPVLIKKENFIRVFPTTKRKGKGWICAFCKLVELETKPKILKVIIGEKAAMQLDRGYYPIEQEVTLHQLCIEELGLQDKDTYELKPCPGCFPTWSKIQGDRLVNSVYAERFNYE